MERACGLRQALRVVSAVIAACLIGSLGPVRSQEASELEGLFKIGDGAAARGAEFAVPFFLSANDVIWAYAISVDFDEEVLEATAIEPIWQRSDGAKYEFVRYELNNKNQTPGNGGIDEGFITWVTIFSPTTADFFIPANEETEALKLHFRVRPESQAYLTEIRLMDGAWPKGAGSPISNLINSIEIISPDLMGSRIFVDGRVTVLPDITTFDRGDANGDTQVDVSDAIYVLSYLYLGGPPPVSFTAADYTLDGRLDISDPMATLSFLFMGG